MGEGVWPDVCLVAGCTLRNISLQNVIALSERAGWLSLEGL
jgi:hypothetical protein